MISMNKKYPDNIDYLLERVGYQKCQVQITDLIFVRENELYQEMKNIRAEIAKCESLLLKQDKLIELSKLIGEAKGLERLFRAILVSPLKTPMRTV